MKKIVTIYLLKNGRMKIDLGKQKIPLFILLNTLGELIIFLSEKGCEIEEWKIKTLKGGKA